MARSNPAYPFNQLHHEALNSGRGRNKPSESATKGGVTNDSKEQSDSDEEIETRPATTYSDSLFTQD